MSAAELVANPKSKAKARRSRIDDECEEEKEETIVVVAKEEEGSVVLSVAKIVLLASIGFGVGYVAYSYLSEQFSQECVLFKPKPLASPANSPRSS